MKVLVLGGTGFIGSGLLAALDADADIEPSWITRRATDAIRGINAPPTILRDLTAIELDWAAEFDVVVDLVSAGRTRFNPTRDITSRVAGHFRLIDGLLNRQSDTRFIFLSSGGAVYGSGNSGCTPEDTALQPSTEYGLEKALIEKHLFYAANQGLQSTTLRVANIYGLGQPIIPGFGVIPALLHSLEKGEPFQLYGSVDNKRDYIHAEDVTAALVAAIKHGKGLGPVNIGTGVGTSVRELISLVEKIAFRTIAIEQLYVDRAEPEFVCLNTERAKQELNWSPKVELEDGVREIFSDLFSEQRPNTQRT
jgi:UDP-glucose 4-epimerase